MSDVLNTSRSLPADEAEEYLLTMERSRRFHETGNGHTIEAVARWMQERRKDPSAACPSPDVSS